VFVDLIAAVAVGIILAFFVTARALEAEELKGIEVEDGKRESRYPLSPKEQDMLRDADGRILLTRLRGAFSYASAREMSRRVSDEVLGHRCVIYDFSEMGYVDPSTAVTINDLFDQARSNDQSVYVCGLAGRVEKTLTGFGAFEHLEPGHILVNRAAAIAAAHEQIMAEAKDD